MVHVMNLQSVPFELIAKRKKTIELRLNDEKRKRISVGDTILFINSENTQILINVTVISLVFSMNFQELFKIITLEECGCLDTGSYPNMSEYYTIEQQENYGVVGIRFEIKHFTDMTNIQDSFDEFKLLDSAIERFPESRMSIDYNKSNDFQYCSYGTADFSWDIENDCSFVTREYDNGFSEIHYDDLEIVMSIMRDIRDKRDLITVVNSIALPNNCRLRFVRKDSLELCDLENKEKYVINKSGNIQFDGSISSSLERCFDEIYEKVYKVARYEMLALNGLL